MFLIGAQIISSMFGYLDQEIIFDRWKNKNSKEPAIINNFHGALFPSY